MRRYLLDTNAVGDFLNRRYNFPQRVQKERGNGVVIGTCEPVVAELFFGVENSSSRAENLVRLQRGLRRLKCWPLTRAASAKFGELAAELRRAGRPIGQIDILVAAIAMTLGNCTVVSIDTDMGAIPGLSVEDWR